MVVKTVTHFEIPAEDVEALSKFYSEVFGWRFEKSPMEQMDYWLIATGPMGRSVGGGMYKKTSAGDAPRNFISVDRIDKTIDSFLAAGGKEAVGKQEVPGFGWSYIGVDPEGNMIGLFEPVRRRRARRSTRASKRGRRR